MVCGRLCWVVWGFYVVGMCRCESRGMKKESLTSIRRLKISDSPLSPAVRTRLELATPCVTGRYSNQLNYRTKGLLSRLTSVLENSSLGVPLRFFKRRWFPFRLRVQSYTPFLIPPNFFATFFKKSAIFPCFPLKNPLSGLFRGGSILFFTGDFYQFKAVGGFFDDLHIIVAKLDGGAFSRNLAC